MRMFILLFIFVQPSLCWGIAVGSASESWKLQGELEKRARENLVGILGSNSPFSVAVKLKISANNVAALPPRSFNQSVGALELSGIELLVHIPSHYSDASLVTIQQFLKSSFSELNAEVEIKKVDFPKVQSEKETHPKGADKNSEITSKDSFNGIGFWSLPIALLALGGALLGGLSLLAKGVQSAVGSLGKNLASAMERGAALSSTVAPTTGASSTSVNSAASSGPSLKGESTPSPMPFLNRNLSVVKQTLREYPTSLVRELSSMKRAGEGFRWLLLLLTPEEQETIKSYLGETRLSQLASEASAAEKESTFESKSKWLDELSERLMLSRVRGKTILEEALENETIVTFLLTPADELIRSVEVVKQKAAWRILAEFLPKEDFQAYLAKSPIPKWADIVDASELDANSIQASANAILDELAKSPVKVASKADRSRYFQSVLIEPVVAALRKMSLGQQDEVVSKLKKVATDLVPLIEERIWTPRYLTRVPPEYMAEFLKEIPMEHRVALVLGLPPDLAERVVELLPKGNIKIVVQDQVKRIESRGDDRERHQYSEMCRGLIQVLREKALNREFRLLRPDEIDEQPSDDNSLDGNSEDTVISEAA